MSRLGQKRKMRKYNSVIHILFWVVVSGLVSAALILAIAKNNTINNFFSDYFPEKKEVVFIETEPIVFHQIVTVEKEVEWFYFNATGYSANDPAQGTNSTTATGKEIRKGMIAVDPKVIPLGTLVEIKDIGTFIAEDTGGKIKGNRIDIYFESKEEARQFGKQGIWVRFIEDEIWLADLLPDHIWSVE